MKVKTTCDALLAAIFLVVASCATHQPVIESPPGKYEIHQKDDRGVTVAVYKVTKFSETITKQGMLLTIVDNKGAPVVMKSYDIFKL